MTTTSGTLAIGPIPNGVRERRSSRRSRRAGSWTDAGLRVGEPEPNTSGRRHRRRRAPVHDFFVEHGRKVTPYAIPISIVRMMSSEISISLRLRGISHALSRGCTSSTDILRMRRRSSDREKPISCCRAAPCVRHARDDVRSRMRVVSTVLTRCRSRLRSRARRVRARRAPGWSSWSTSGAPRCDHYASTGQARPAAYHRVQMAPDGEEIVRALTLAVERSGRHSSRSAT